MGIYKYIRNLWKSKKKDEDIKELWKQRLIEWRREPSIVRIEKPTRLDRARSLGYRSKKGIFVVRIRLPRGGHKRRQIKKGRRSKHSSQRMDLVKNYQHIAEIRVNDKYKNCEVLNSYYVAKDGRYYWYEIILIDRDSPSIKSDKILNWISNVKGRSYRGLTSSAKKAKVDPKKK